MTNAEGVSSKDRILNLENQTGYKIHQIPFTDLRKIAWSDITVSLVHWNSSSGYQSDRSQITLGAAVCYAGVSFVSRDGLFIPNLFHFYPNSTYTPDQIRLFLDLPHENALGVVGSMKKSLITDEGKIYTNDLGLIPLIGQDGEIFNIYVSPIKKLILYAFS